MSTANRLASLGLPSELLTAVAEVTSYLHRTFCTTLTSLQMGLDINQLLELQYKKETVLTKHRNTGPVAKNDI